MSHVQQTLDGLKAIPPHRRREKLVKSAQALSLAVIGGAVAWKLPAWPIWVPIVFWVAAAHRFSAEWTNAFAKFAVALVKDLLGAIRGSKDGPPPAL